MKIKIEVTISRPEFPFVRKEGSLSVLPGLVEKTLVESLERFFGEMIEVKSSDPLLILKRKT